LLDINSLLKLNYGMYIVSSAKDGKFNGCIVNSLFQIVPEPPMIATSINKECLTHEYITNSNILTASVLSIKADMAFIRGFGFRSGRDINKFENINYKLGQEDAPIIVDNTVAFVEARVLHSYEIETHTLFIAKVTACETTNPSEEPMTYTHYRDIKHGRTPKAAATYYKPESHKQLKKGANKMKKYECTVCGYIYDPQAGDPENNIEPGTAFEDLPDDWVCPECGAGKEDFEPVEE